MHQDVLEVVHVSMIRSEKIAKGDKNALNGHDIKI